MQAQGPVAGRIVYSMEVQTRFNQGASRLSLVQSQAAAGLKIGKHVSVLQGYGHLALPVRGGADRNEERSYQQLIWLAGRIGPGDLALRTQVEERWRSGGGGMQLRVRERVRYLVPVGGPVRAVAQAEGFYVANATEWNPRSGAEQLRLSAGAEITLATHLTVEADYLHIVADAAGGRRSAVNALTFTLAMRR